jgi:mannosylglycerate hydrolase
MNKKSVYVVSTVHWDREWYWAQEQFRMRLVELVDNVLDILENVPGYKHFFFDGQVMAIEDYLEIKPENRGRVEKLVQSGKLGIGSWYNMPDLFLSDGESLIRNLLLGDKMAKGLGKVVKIGYAPDCFGNNQMMPQIMNGFGIKDYFFMRGMDKDDYKRLGSEFIWKSPDGSQLFTTYMVEGYFGAGALGFKDTFFDYRGLKPNKDVAVEEMKTMLNNYGKEFKSDKYLLFNGSDHTPPQKEIPELLDYLNKNIPDVGFRHSTTDEYLADRKQNIEGLPVYHGELTGGNLHVILRSVLSTRMYLKQKNYYNERLLEKYAEPVTTFLSIHKTIDYQANLDYAWKMLLQNQAHDAICGCSIDEVHQFMLNRYDRVSDVGEYIMDKGIDHLAENINTSEQEGIPVFIYNPLNWERKEVIRAKVLVKNPALDFDSYILVDNNANPVPFTITNKLVDYTIGLNEWKYYQAIEIEFVASIPSFGYAVYHLQFGEQESKKVNEVKADKNSLENEFYKITVNKNGSLNIFDKINGAKYKDFNLLEDTEDDGDEYTYSFVEESQTLTTKNVEANITIHDVTHVSATLKIEIDFKLPECLDKSRTKRSKKFVSNKITTYISLKAHSDRIDIKTELDNVSKDHRLRVLFPSKFSDFKNYADGHFNVVDRKKYFPAKPTEREKVEYYPTQHQNNFVTLTNGTSGVTIVNEGLPEYEILKDSTIAVTLLRSIGRLNKNNLMTRWRMAGPDLETPEAQCLGKNSFSYSVILHKKSWENSYISAHQFNYPLFAKSVNRNSGESPAVLSFAEIKPRDLILSAFKQSGDKSGYILRFYNIKSKDVKGEISFYKPVSKCYLTNLAEEVISEIKIENGKIVLDVPANKIVTLKLVL